MPPSDHAAADIEETLGAPADALASDRDSTGTPIHRGWAPLGGRHRWMEPFVLAVLATGHGQAHGYAITGELEAIGITGGDVDIGQVYRTLRDLEHAGHVTSTWSSEPVGPQRREYALTECRLRRARRVGRGDEGAGAAHRRVRGSIPGRGHRPARTASVALAAATPAKRSCLHRLRVGVLDAPRQLVDLLR